MHSLFCNLDDLSQVSDRCLKCGAIVKFFSKILIFQVPISVFLEI